MIAHRTPKNELHARTSRTLFRKDFARTFATHTLCISLGMLLMQFEFSYLVTCGVKIRYYSRLWYYEDSNEYCIFLVLEARVDNYSVLLSIQLWSLHELVQLNLPFQTFRKQKLRFDWFIICIVKMYCIFKFLWVYSQFIHKILVNGYFYEMQNACNYLKLQELMILFQRHMQHKLKSCC